MKGVPHPETVAVLERHRFVRFIPNGALPRQRDAAAKKLCGWCHDPLPGRRLSWCSDECSNEFWVRFSSSHVAGKVFRRDAGVCTSCGLDTEKVKRVRRELQSRAQRARHREYYQAVGGRAAALVVLARQAPTRLARLDKFLADRGFVDFDRTLWEADHIIPVVEGGGCCGLENYRTLCVPCHRRETAELAGRRAAQRNPQRRLNLETGDGNSSPVSQ